MKWLVVLVSLGFLDLECCSIAATSSCAATTEHYRDHGGRCRLLRSWLWERDQYSDARFTGDERSSIHAVLQYGSLLPREPRC